MEKGDESKPTLRDLDDAFNEREIKAIESSVKGRSSMIVALILVGIYIFISTIIWGMFFYRGGPIRTGVEGLILDVLVIALIVYATSEDSKDKATQVIFGTIICMVIDSVAKNLFLYPFIVKILGM